MAILNASFVQEFATIKADDGNFTPVPAGDYTVQITGSELKDTKDGSGQYVKAEFTVLGPAYQGRKIFQNYNIFNKNADAEQIGRAQLKSLTTAVGLDTLRDTDELIGRRAFVHVAVVPDKNGKYGDQNRLSRYRHADAAAVNPMAAPSPTADAGSFNDAFGGFVHTAPTIPAGNGGFNFQ